MADEKPKALGGGLLGGLSGGALSTLAAGSRGGLIGGALNTGIDPYASAISQIFSKYPYRVENRYFQQQRVSLDGYHFVHCRFDECELVMTKATFVIERCVFGSCKLAFGGEALNAIKLFNIFSEGAFQRENPYFCPAYDPVTGSYTIA